MRVVVNGEPTELPQDTTIAALVDRMGLGEAHVAIAVDGTFVPRSAHDTTELAEGAQVEVLAPMQGG